MYLDYDENRPETPRVPQALTRLERLLLAVVAYQFLLLSYFLAPDSLFARPVKALVAPDEPIRFVEIQPLVERPALAKLSSPPSDLDRRASEPKPIPRPDTLQTPPQNSPDTSQAAPPQPRANESPRTLTAPPAREAPPAPRAVPGGILGSALRNLDRYVQDSAVLDNPEGGAWENGPSIQFDSKGIDFGPWLRRFRAQVYRNWLIPQAAYVMHGHVVIQMAILRDGAIVNPRIVQPSGIDAFDSAAMTALKLSNPTMRLPDVYPGNAIDPFTVIFYYNEQPR